MQFDMFGIDEPPVEVMPAPAVDVVEYAPVEPYEPRPDNAAALIGWTLRTQRKGLMYWIAAIGRVTDGHAFFVQGARDVLFRLDGLGSDW